MIPGISSQIFLSHRLTPALLEALRGGGARAVELWAARYHVDSGDRQQVRELARWFGDTGTVATMHMPRTADTEFSRHASPSVNLLDLDRGRRIGAMDEVKRALELAETIPVRSCVLHLGAHDSDWGEQTLELSVRALEHLYAFAGPLGVQLLLENLHNDVTTPAHLLEILRVGHFDRCGLCLDLGHAYASGGVADGSDGGIDAALQIMSPRLRELHVYDTTGAPGVPAHEQPHLWPASGPEPPARSERPAWAARGVLDWPNLYPRLAALPEDVAAILEIHHTEAPTPEAASRMLAQVLSHRRRLLEESASRPAQEV